MTQTAASRNYDASQMPSQSLIFAAALAVARAANDGVALTPPRGWRSWNYWQGHIDQQIIMSSIDAMTDTSRGGVSLALLGYSDVGVDDAWQMCGSYGPLNYTYHLEDGTPVLNTTRFPSLNTMTAYAHSHNLTAGWYGNNCICKDHISDAISFAAEANFIMDAGFDSLKLDGCGAQENIELWYDIFAWARSRPNTARSGKMILLENCHNGPHSGSPAANSSFGPYVPTKDWCPFHTYRSSTDIAPVFGSILSNLETIPPLAEANLSTPGCWAYRASHARLMARPHTCSSPQPHPPHSRIQPTCSRLATTICRTSASRRSPSLSRARTLAPSQSSLRRSCSDST